MFVDEAGTPPNKPEKERFTFLISGVILKIDDWPIIAKEFFNIKSKYQILDKEIKWKYFSPAHEDYGISKDKEQELRCELFSLLNQPEKLTAITVLCDNSKMFGKSYINDREDVYEICYKALLERFQYFLQEHNSYGVVVCDARDGRSDNKLREKHKEMCYANSPFCSNLSRIVEGILITPSHFSIGVQLADLVAGSVLRYAKKKDCPVYSIVKNIFRKSTNGKLHGYGIVLIPK